MRTQRTFTFTDGTFFVVKSDSDQVWVKGGYLTKDQARLEFKHLLNQGLTYTTEERELSGVAPAPVSADEFSRHFRYTVRRVRPGYEHAEATTWK